MVLSYIAVIILLAGAARLLQKERSRTGLLLAAPLVATALLEVCDLGAVSGLAAPFTWKGCSLLVEALLPPLWLLCSLNYGRDIGAGVWSSKARLAALASVLLVAVPAVFPVGALLYAPDFPGAFFLWGRRTW